MVDSKEYGRDKEQYDNKHKQLYSFGSEDSFPALDRKLEKDMVFVLQNLKDVKVISSIIFYIHHFLNGINCYITGEFVRSSMSLLLL